MYSPVFCSTGIPGPRAQDPGPNAQHYIPPVHRSCVNKYCLIIVRGLQESIWWPRLPPDARAYQTPSLYAHTAHRRVGSWASRFAGKAAAISSHLINQASSKYQPPNLIVISKSSSTPPLLHFLLHFLLHQIPRLLVARLWGPGFRWFAAQVLPRRSKPPPIASCCTCFSDAMPLCDCSTSSWAMSH